MKNTKPMLFALENSLQLGKKISKILNIDLSKVNKVTFADGEILLKSENTVRNKDVFVIASTSKPVNENIMELLIFIDSLKRASAKSITAVITYFGYARQDRKSAGRQPISSKLVANLLETAGATKVIAIDLHNSSIQGFFNIPVDDLRGQYIIALETKKFGKFTVVSPDHGGSVRARLLAELISDTVQIAIVDKRRIGKNESQTLGILGNVKNKNIIIVDDMIDSGGTIINAAKMAKKQGANKIIVAATHGIFSKGFSKFDKEKSIDKIFITDTISSVYEIKSNKLKIISVDQLVADVIKASINSTSVANIYKKIKTKM